MNAPARAPIDALLADQGVSEEFKAHVAPSYAATGQLLGRALAEIGRTAPKPLPARHWLSKCLIFEAASEVLEDYYGTGEVTKDQDPDIAFEEKSGLWVVSIAGGEC